jgi:hypothetical protein
VTFIIRHPQNFWIGIIFMFFGLAAIYFGLEHEMGTAGRMGPSYFPSVLGAMLALAGLANVVRSFIGRGETIGKFHIKNIVVILTAVLLFGALMRTAGLAVAAFVLIMLSSWASPRFELKANLLLAVGLTTFAVVVFVKLLGLPMPILGPWFTKG